MFVDTSIQRSDAYVGTFSKSQEDLLEIQQIRKIVKNLNRDLKDFGYDYRYYVKLQGRGVKLLALAKKIDAYIYRR